MILLAIGYCNALGPMPWKDSSSRKINEQLKSKLEKMEDANLSDIFQEKGEDVYLFFLPPYFNLADIDCHVFSQDFLKALKVKKSLQDGISILVLIDSAKVVAEIPVNSDEFLCYDFLQPSCMLINDALLQWTRLSDKPCFKLVEKEMRYE